MSMSTTTSTSSAFKHDENEDDGPQAQSQPMSGALSEKVGCFIGPSKKYELMDLIGVGTFAAVYLAQDQDGTEYAVKTLFKKGLTPAELNVQRNEILIHSRLSHIPGIVTLEETVEDDECLYLVLEHCPSDMYSVIQSRRFNDEEAKAVFAELLDTVDCMHQLGVYHRDLKPENILISKDGHLRLADFGLSTTSHFCTDLGCGTRGYLAPETLDERLEGYDPLFTDLWALAMILVNVRFQCKLWNEADPRRDPFYDDFLSLGPKLYFQVHFEGFSDQFVKFLADCFALNPLDRLTLAEMHKAIANKDILFWDEEALVKRKEQVVGSVDSGYGYDEEDILDKVNEMKLRDEHQEEEEEELVSLIPQKVQVGGF